MDSNGAVRAPPALLRIPMAPAKTQTKKLRIASRVSQHDIAEGKLSHNPITNQIILNNSTKFHSKNAFDVVFGSDVAQDEIASNILPDLLQSFFNGSDCSLVSVGGFSKAKESSLYEAGPCNLGLFQTALAWTFRLVEEFKVKRPEFRYSIRISALYFSQRDNQLTDLLSPFNPDPRRHSVRVADDVTTGTRIENESEIRVDSVDQAMFYLNTVVDHRLVEDDETHRVNHLFFFMSLYGFRSGSNGIESGGKSNLAIVDLGIGERNSQKGDLTMPAIGNMLLALYQGQKHIPSRDNLLCQLLKVSLGTSKNSVLLCTFTDRTDDNENLLQLASKLARAKKSSRRIKSIGDGTSLSSGTSSRRNRSDVESSSEQSAAETVIFLGPSTSKTSQSSPSHSLKLSSLRCPSQASTLVSNGSSGGKTVTSIPPLVKNHTPFFSPISRLYDDLCSPSTSYAPFEEFLAYGGVTSQEREDFGITIAPPKKSKSRTILDEEKRKAIMTWMDGHESERTDTGIQCGDGEVVRDWENDERDNWAPQRPPLEDIIEMDEESMKSSLRSNGNVQYPRRDPREREGLADHPLSILSRDNINHVSSLNEKAFDESEGDDDDLERAMAASISSIKSHEILSRINKESQAQESMVSLSGSASEMDMYRRASQLEDYAANRVKEMDDEKKRKKNKLMLSCCQQQTSTISSGSSAILNWDQVEKRREKEETQRRKEELRRRKDELKAEEMELRRQRQEIKRELDETVLIPPIAQNIARQITNQLHKFSLGSSPKHTALRPHASDSLPTTPTISHRRLIPVRTPSLSNMRDSKESRESNGFQSSHHSRTMLFQPLAPHTNGHLKHSSKRIDSLSKDSRKSSKTRSKERRNSENKDDVIIRSPYSKITEARKDTAGTGSSGRGSDDNASGIGLQTTTTRRNRNRDSYSASSGYESASADYHRYTSCKDTKLNRLRLLDKNYTGTTLEIERLREIQRRLRRELIEARERIGQRDPDNWRGEHDTTVASPHTLIDALLQENRILEKRLVACQNHVICVTSLM